MEVKTSSKPNSDHLKILSLKFGHKNFKKEQWAVIDSIVSDKRDSLIVAGTGFGKSLIYQFPPVYLSKKAIVISPLISLMEDQVLALQKKGIKACLLGPAQKQKNFDIRKYQVIYLTPELFNEVDGRQKLECIKEKICLVAIDECHCVTQWGSDFRKTFRKLALIKTFLRGVPIVCLTATATQYCINDVCDSLKLVNPLIIKSELNRPNIDFTVTRKQYSFIEDIRYHIADVTDGSVIIYVLRRAESDQFAEELTREGYPCKPYHAGMADKERHQVLKEFAGGNLRFIVATIAFGMGIDRSDVRIVIHYGCPRNLECFYQESGRAGRDGKQSKSIVLWNQKDFDFHRYWLIRSGPKVKPEYAAHCSALLEQMENFTSTSTCRRMLILSHFNPDQLQLPIHENCCDNCRYTLHTRIPLHKIYLNISKKGMLNVSNDARVLLNLVKSYQGKCDERSIVRFLKGELPTTKNRNHPLEVFGNGKSKSDGWWRKLVAILLQKGLIKKRIEVQRFPMQADGDDEIEMIIRREDVLKITRSGSKFLKRQTRKLAFRPPLDVFKFLNKTDVEYFIVNDAVKCKRRTPPATPRPVVKRLESTEDLFKFEFSQTKPKKSSLKETAEDGGPSCSSPQKPFNKVEKEEENLQPQEESEGSDLESDLEDDEHLENVLWNYEATNRPINDLDELLQFIESSSDEQQHVPINTEISNDALPSTPTTSHIKFIENSSLRFSLKRLSQLFDGESEVPSKVFHLSQDKEQTLQ